MIIGGLEIIVSRLAMAGDPGMLYVGGRDNWRAVDREQSYSPSLGSRDSLHFKHGQNGLIARVPEQVLIMLMTQMDNEHQLKFEEGNTYWDQDLWTSGIIELLAGRVRIGMGLSG